MFYLIIFSTITQGITHWGRVTHICVGKLTIVGSDNGLSPERRQAIIWTNAGILLIGPLGTNFSEILIEIQTFSLKKIRLKMSSAKCCSFRLGFNVITCSCHIFACCAKGIYLLEEYLSGWVTRSIRLLHNGEHMYITCQVQRRSFDYEDGGRWKEYFSYDDMFTWRNRISSDWGVRGGGGWGSDVKPFGDITLHQ